MKKNLLLAALLMSAFASWAQLDGVNLNGYAGYVFDNKFDTYYTSNEYIRGKINGGFQWGVGMEFLLNEDYGVELLYIRQDTEASITYQRGIGQGQESRVVDLGVNYIAIGGVRYLNLASDKVQPYGGLLLGVAIFGNKNALPQENDSYTKFAWGARLGTNIWMTERVGLKLQAQLLSAVQAFGGGFYFGSGGSSVGVSTYSTLLQFTLGGGLVIKLKAP